jgi:hypothetical protein
MGTQCAGCGGKQGRRTCSCRSARPRSIDGFQKMIERLSARAKLGKENGFLHDQDPKWTFQSDSFLDSKADIGCCGHVQHSANCFRTPLKRPMRFGRTFFDGSIGSPNGRYESAQSKCPRCANQVSR